MHLNLWPLWYAEAHIFLHDSLCHHLWTGWTSCQNFSQFSYHKQVSKRSKNWFLVTSPLLGLAQGFLWQNLSSFSEHIWNIIKCGFFLRSYCYIIYIHYRCEKITLFGAENKGSLIIVWQWLSCQHPFKQIFSTVCVIKIFHDLNPTRQICQISAKFLLISV